MTCSRTPSRRRLRRTWVAWSAAGLLAVPPLAGLSPVQAAPGPTPVPTPTQSARADDSDFARLTPEVTRQLDQAIQEVLKKANVPGVAVSVSAPGKGQYLRAFGVADKATGQKMTTDMYVRIGSETKTFTVTAMLELVDQGKLGLDDPISKYVAGVPNGDRITLRNLAGMRSGLFNYSEDDGFVKALETEPNKRFTPQQLLDYAFKHPIQFQPGAKFSYSNTNLILIGLVVEKVGGLPLHEYIQRHVLDPAGLRQTLFPTGGEFPQPHPQGYTDETVSGKVAVSTDWDPSWAWAAGAMISNLPDLRSWARTVATGTLLEPATQAQRLRTEPTGVQGAGYGLGIFDIQGWIGHNGSLPGYETLTIYLPGPDATVVVMLNTDILYDKVIEPSTLFGEAITKIVSPEHVFNLPVPASATR
ncbi:serine hydrolase domain-containing protein [Streptomyces antimicrobicus]|uniref:Beta-lactamase family protein n=1 Tax=Streptomyces antimicrobicus TaxID=2883108 RepID=A0ABS8BE76_9ACTN|nr:serine hydrolase domain-containing protein [Streptomyces antimicrobicus]MCB5182937.1 beta-lactamase family protein [Streptomyces antimicrobicus]